MDKAEEQIQRAIEQGQFDNLPGKGKPLKIGENPHEPAEWRLAMHLLRANGFTLPWIELRKEIEATLERARRDLTRAWVWCKRAQGTGESPEAIKAEWNRAVETFRASGEALNRRIVHYNLHAPSAQFHRRLVNVDQEIEEVLHGSGVD